jgi:hypothetical protein
VEIAFADQLRFGYLHDEEKTRTLHKKREECGTHKFKVEGCATRPHIVCSRRVEPRSVLPQNALTLVELLN